MFVKTLVTMGGILAFLLVGIVGLAYWYGVMPETETTVLSQLAMNILGHNVWLLFCSIQVLQRFPMLAASMAKDKYMPRMFSVRGDRLGYSNSIITLGVGAILLIIIFDGKTENLIPLYVCRCIYSIHISTIWHGT